MPALLFLGIAPATGRIPLLFVGWHLYRGHGWQGIEKHHVAVHHGCFSACLVPDPVVNGQSWALARTDAFSGCPGAEPMDGSPAGGVR